MLFFEKLFEDTDFQGGINTWMIGCPLMAFIVAINLNTHASILLKNKAKIQKPEEYEK